jgi:GTPase SAR1 family protein
MLLGNTGCGKTTLLNTYIEDPTAKTYPTVGVDLKTKQIEFMAKQMILLFYDCSG